MKNVYTFKIKVTTKGKAQKSSLRRKTRKVSNLKKIDLMFSFVKNKNKNKNKNL